MATEFDTKFRSLAVKLVGKFGVSEGNSKYISLTRGDTDPSAILSSGGDIEETETEFDIKMTPPLRYKKEDIDGSVIQTHDTYVFIAGKDWDETIAGVIDLPTGNINVFPMTFPFVFAVDPIVVSPPKVSDQVLINTENLTIISIEPIYSGDQVAAYKLQLRRGQ